MAWAGEVVLAAGPEMKPGAEGVDEPGFDKLGPAMMIVLNAGDGQGLCRTSRPAQPVFDGMAVANGKVYVSLIDGSVVCMAGSAP